MSAMYSCLRFTQDNDTWCDTWHVRIFFVEIFPYPGGYRMVLLTCAKRIHPQGTVNKKIILHQ